MNIRKPVDYSALYADLDKLMAVELPQMERYREMADWSAPGSRKARRSRPPNICRPHIPRPQASPCVICGVCGNSAASMTAILF